MAVNYDPNLIGKVFETTDAVEVKAERIKTFCDTLGETNPLYAGARASMRARMLSLSGPSTRATRSR